MTYVGLFFELRKRGIVATPNGDRLDLQDPNRQLTPELLIKLKASKRDLLLLLKDLNNRRNSLIYAEDKAYYPLSKLQRFIYTHQLNHSDTCLYNMPQLLKLEKHWPYAEVEQALNKIIQQHRLLRSSIVKRPEGAFIQINDKSFSPARHFMSILDLDLVKKDLVYPFDLERELFRVIFIETQTCNYLLVDFHHLIADAQSVRNLVTTFKGLMRKETSHEEVDWFDYLIWCNQTADKPITELTKFVREIALQPPIPLTTFPYDFSWKNMSLTNSNMLHQLVVEDVTNLQKFCYRNKTTIPSVLIAILGLLVYKVTSQDDILLGSTSSFRMIHSLDGIIGPLVQIVPVRMRLRESDRIRDLVNDIFNLTTTFLAYPGDAAYHDDLNYQVVFNYLGVTSNRKPPELLNINPSSAKFDMVWHFTIVDSQLHLIVEYRQKYFESEYIRLYVGYFSNLLAQFMAKEDANLEDLQLPVKLDTLVETRKRKLDFESLTDWFDVIANSNFHQIALRYKEHQITYGGLQSRVNKMANALNERGVTVQTIVALCMEPGIDQITVILAILKCGGIYLPINPQLPNARISFLLEDSKTQHILVSDKMVQSRLSALSLSETILLEDLNEDSYNASYDKNVSRKIAYIIYTSGTTGGSKGVIVSHDNVLELLTSCYQAYNFEQRDIWTLTHSYSFDFSVWEIFAALLSGATLVILPQEKVRDLYAQILTFDKYQVTILNQTPTAFYRLSDTLLSLKTDVHLAVRVLIFGGETLLTKNLSDWRKRMPSCRIYNMYGITETTVHVTLREILDEHIETNQSNIGIPLDHLSVDLLDQKGRPTSLGAIGEMLVSGTGIADGYLNLVELTHQKFIIRADGERSYKSGDLGRRTLQGDLLYISRNDQQVQLRGYRIEISEVESTLLRHTSVSSCVVVKHEHNENLIAYVVLKDDLSTNKLQKYLRSQLPAYMVPAHLMALDSLPITINGKLDKARLPAITHHQRRVPKDQTFDIRKIWGEVLDIDPDKINKVASFFELGGNSIKVIDLLGRLFEEMKVELSVPELYANETPEKQYQLIQKREKKAFKTLVRAERLTHYPLSHSQTRTYVLHRMATKGALIGNVPMIIPMAGEITREQLGGVTETIMMRHEIFRTTFMMRRHRVFQRVHQEPQLVVIEPEEPLSLRECQQKISNFIRPFDLECLPLVRIKLLRLRNTSRIYLLLDVHHIVADWFTLRILREEITKLLMGQNLPSVPYQYTDYVMMERAEGFQARLQQSGQYWLEELGHDLPSLSLPYDFPKGARSKTYSGNNYTFSIEADLLEEIRLSAEAERATTYTFMLAAFYLFLTEVAHTRDMMIGLVVSGRKHLDLKQIAGVFINMIPLRIKTAEDISTSHLLSHVQKRISMGLEHQEFPYDKMIEKVIKNTSRQELFQVGFSMLSEPNLLSSAQEDEKKLEQMVRNAHQISHSHLTFYGTELKNRIVISVEFNPNTFKNETIRAFHQKYIRVIQRMLNLTLKNH